MIETIFNFRLKIYNKETLLQAMYCSYPKSKLRCSVKIAPSYITKNTVISPEFLVWKFCGKVQFPHSFGRIVRNFAETMLFREISTPGNQMKLRYFSQCQFLSNKLKAAILRLIQKDVMLTNRCFCVLDDAFRFVNITYFYINL